MGWSILSGAGKDKDEQFRRRSEELVRKMGYEFQIAEVTHSASVKAKQSVRLSLKGKNLGVAPFYYQWTVEWALLDSTGKVVKKCETDWDIRKWTPGDFSEDAKLTFDVPAGTYRLGLGIRDPCMAGSSSHPIRQRFARNGWMDNSLED